MRVRQAWNARFARASRHALLRAIQCREDPYKAGQLAVAALKGIGEFSPDVAPSSQSMAIMLSPDLQAALTGRAQPALESD